MIKTIIIFSTVYFLLLSISGCNQNNPSPNLTLKWTATIEGQTYSWQGSYPNDVSSGNAITAYNQANGSLNIILSIQGVTKSLNISLPTAGVGSHVVTGGSPSSPGNKNIGFYNGSTISYTTLAGGSVTFNVTEYSQNAFEIVKGNFNGTIGKFPSGGNKPISGSFEAVRYN